MSLFRIALRSIQQRGVASLLTMLSMALGVMLVVAVLTIFGIVSQSFRNNASLGYNMLIGAKGGREQLVLNSIYYLSSPVENIPYEYYLEFLDKPQREQLLRDSLRRKAADQRWETISAASAAVDGGLSELVAAAVLPSVEKIEAQRLNLDRDGMFGAMTELAIPLCLGDYYGQFRVVGTTPALFDDLVWDIENNRKYEFAQGRNFQHRSEENGYFEAVVGSVVAREMDVKIGDKISPAHGDPEGHTHERKFTVVGILAPSGTPNDRAVFVNMEGFYLMEDHAKPIEEQRKPDAEEEPTPQSEAEAKAAAMEAAKKRAEIERAPDPDPLPVESREVTAILLKTPTMIAPGLENAINEGPTAQAVLPVAVIYGMFEFFVSPIQWTLLLLTAMICVVSGVSILVSIYNSMSERRHEIAVMRALGAGRGTVMTTILLESALLALGGGVLGWLLGHTATLIASPWIEKNTGVRVAFWSWEPSVRILEVMGVQGSAAQTFTLPVEVVLIPALLLLAIIVGFWPAMSAYRTDVAESLGK
jgi:putative ABC transport system permease protein